MSNVAGDKEPLELFRRSPLTPPRPFWAAGGGARRAAAWGLGELDRVWGKKNKKNKNNKKKKENKK
jgi:hypothetical protein